MEYHIHRTGLDIKTYLKKPTKKAKTVFQKKPRFFQPWPCTVPEQWYIVVLDTLIVRVTYLLTNLRTRERIRGRLGVGLCQWGYERNYRLNTGWVWESRGNSGDPGKYVTACVFSSVEWLVVDESDKLFEDGETGFRDQVGMSVCTLLIKWTFVAIVSTLVNYSPRHR